jgi:uncharacterized membrane protein YhaH (DUF805 family)
MFCTKCGTKAESGDLFCENCGNKFGSKGSKKAQTTKAVEPETEVAELEPQGYKFGNIFKGRLSRSNYWALFGTWILASFTAMLLIIALSTNYGDALSGTLVVVYLLALLYFVILHIGALIRRAHDMNRSGATVLLIFVPIVGWAFGLWLALGAPVDKDNNYGEYNDRSVDFGLIFGGKNSEEM